MGNFAVMVVLMSVWDSGIVQNNILQQYFLPVKYYKGSYEVAAQLF